MFVYTVYVCASYTKKIIGVRVKSILTKHKGILSSILVSPIL